MDNGFTKKQSIVQQGNLATALYVVVEGEVTINKVISKEDFDAIQHRWHCAQASAGSHRPSSSLPRIDDLCWDDLSLHSQQTTKPVGDEDEPQQRWTGREEEEETIRATAAWKSHVKKVVPVITLKKGDVFGDECVVCYHCRLPHAPSPVHGCLSVPEDDSSAEEEDHHDALPATQPPRRDRYCGCENPLTITNYTAKANSDTVKVIVINKTDAYEYLRVGSRFPRPLLCCYGCVS